MTALESALEYVAAGYTLGPVTVRVSADGRKRPLFHTLWQRDDAERGVSCDPRKVELWARVFPGCGFHAPCRANGIVVVEGDVGEDYDGRESWRAAGGPETSMTVTTQGGGEHWYFRAPAGVPIRNTAGALAGIPHVDVRGDGGTVFTAGTQVHGGGRYTAPRIVPLAELPELSPEWVARLHAASVPRPERGTGQVVRRRPPRGPRHADNVQARARGRVHTETWIRAAVDDELRLLGRAREDFRVRLFAASALAFRAVGAGLMTVNEAKARLGGAVTAVWGTAPDEDDLRWIDEGWRAAEQDPWEISDVTRESV